MRISAARSLAAPTLSNPNKLAVAGFVIRDYESAGWTREEADQALNRLETFPGDLTTAQAERLISLLSRRIPVGAFLNQVEAFQKTRG